MAERFSLLAAERGLPAIAEIGDPDSSARLQMLPVLFSGISLRSIYNPELDRSRMAQLIKQTLATLWRAQPDR